MVNVLVPIQSLMGMMKYFVVGMFILVVVFGIIRARQGWGDTDIQATPAPREEPRRFTAPQATYPPQEAQASEEEKQPEEKKPEKRDRYRAVKV
jgi:hypothetical protein